LEHPGAARAVTKILINKSRQTGIYKNDSGDPMSGSVLVRDQAFANRVVAKTRQLLSIIPF
jgi:hypothetical protein